MKKVKFRNTLANEVKGYRKYTRLSLRQMSKIVGISASTLNRIENGRVPDVISLAILCRLFQDPIHEYIN